MTIFETKPCPFCESLDLSVATDAATSLGHICCLTCDANGPSVPLPPLYSTTQWDWQNEARLAWNRRS